MAWRTDVTKPELYFPDDYQSARSRFRAAAEELSAASHAYQIAEDKDLTIDVARIGDLAADRAVVVTSGVHGVEGPLGAAVQLAWMNQFNRQELPNNVTVILIHAVNPFGFAHHRRWNEDNVDLNRNFLDEEDNYAGSPTGYAQLNALLNPESVPSRWEPFGVLAVWNIMRFGLPAIKQAVAVGQYDFPRGLFFGGKRPGASARIFHDHYQDWLGNASTIVHLDFHTGLGRYGDYRLLLQSDPDSEEARWFTGVLGSEIVEPRSANDAAEGAAGYRPAGMLGAWAARRVADRTFRFATAEFGTYGVIRVLAALRAENRVYHYAANPEQFQWAQRELRECFCPVDTQWRRKVVRLGVDLIARCIDAIQ